MVDPAFDSDQIMMSARVVGPADPSEEEHLLIVTNIGLNFRLNQGLIASVASMSDCCNAPVRIEHRGEDSFRCLTCDGEVRATFNYLAYEKPERLQESFGLTLNISSDGKLLKSYDLTDAIQTLHTLVEDKVDAFSSIIVARDLILYLQNLVADIRTLDFSWWREASDVYQGSLELALARTPYYPVGEEYVSGNNSLS